MTSDPNSPPDPAPSAALYVGFWARTWAGFIDLLAAGLVIAVVAGIVDPWHRTDRHGLMHFTLEYVLPAVAVLAFWFTFGATPGKMAISAVVVDAKTFATPSRQQFVMRYLGYYLSTIVLCLGYVWIAFDERKQGWHDKIAGTVVVRRPRV